MFKRDAELMLTTDIIDGIAHRTNLTESQARAAVRAFKDVVTDYLRDGKIVQMVNFGTFEAVSQAPREIKNLKTGEQMKISPTRIVFTAGEGLKRKVFDHSGGTESG